MKDQGKISELNTSSHRYQSSNTVGRMSETYTPQGFLGFNRHKLYQVPEMGACEEPATRTGLQRTHSRKMRRVRAKMREQESILAAMPKNASQEEIQWALYPKAMKQRTEADDRKIVRQQKHQAYMEFIQEYQDFYYHKKKFSREDYNTFCRYYDAPTPNAKLEAFEEIMLRYNRYLCSVPGDKPSVSIKNFPRANIPAAYHSRLLSGRSSDWEATPPQLGMPDYEDCHYTPHCGTRESELSVPEPPIYQPQSGFVETCTTVSTLVEEFMASPAYAQLYSLCTFERPILSLVVLSVATLVFQLCRYTVLTVNFLSGMLLGVLFSGNRLKYTPQAAPLSADDGAAFTGKAAKASSKPASASAPGIASVPTVGWSATLFNKDANTFASSKPIAQPRVTPPKPIKEDPNNGPLNGFGIGI